MIGYVYIPGERFQTLIVDQVTLLTEETKVNRKERVALSMRVVIAPPNMFAFDP
jgi:hypothetical protein